MKKKRKILIGIGIFILLLFIFIILNYVGTSTYDYAQRAIEKADLSECNKVPILRYQVESEPGLLGSYPVIYYSRDYCRDMAMVIYRPSYYRFNSESDMKSYYSAVRSKDPNKCLSSGAKGACFEAFMYMGLPEVCGLYSDYEVSLNYSMPADIDPKAYYFRFCIDKTTENIDDPSGCDEISRFYGDRTAIIECKSKFVAFGMLNASFCEEYSGIEVWDKYSALGFKDMRSFCYYSLVKTYSSLFGKPALYRDQRLVWYAKEDNGVGRYAYYYPKPTIPYVCDEMKESSRIDGNTVNYKPYCETYYKNFNGYNLTADLKS